MVRVWGALAGGFRLQCQVCGSAGVWGLMAVRLYKVYDVVMTSDGFVVIQILSVTVDHQSCYKFTKFWLHSGPKADFQ